MPVAVPPVVVTPGNLQSGGSVPTQTVTPTGGASPNVVSWDQSGAQDPDPSTLPAIPGNYQNPGDPETLAIQQDLNAWANAVAYDGNLVAFPLTEDGTFGPNTQKATAVFQTWANATESAGLVVDGLPGQNTQPWLSAFGAIAPGDYS
jgi:hypothetical protein